jgi:hypothetical protein
VVVVGAFLYKRYDVVSTFVSEHQRAGSTARVGASSVPEAGCGDVIRGVQCGVRAESKTPVASKWSPNRYRVSLVFS